MQWYKKGFMRSWICIEASGFCFVIHYYACFVYSLAFSNSMLLCHLLLDTHDCVHLVVLRASVKLCAVKLTPPLLARLHSILSSTRYTHETTIRWQERACGPRLLLAMYSLNKSGTRNSCVVSPCTSCACLRHSNVFFYHYQRSILYGSRR